VLNNPRMMIALDPMIILDRECERDLPGMRSGHSAKSTDSL
jgi:hypothetical protein